MSPNPALSSPLGVMNHAMHTFDPERPVGVFKANDAGGR